MIGSTQLSFSKQAANLEVWEVDHPVPPLRTMLPSTSRYASTLIIAIATILILFHDLLRAFVPLNETQLLAICVAALAAILVDFNKTISQHAIEVPAAVRHLSIAEALRVATFRNRHVQILPIMGTTTETILPLFK